MPCCPAPFCCCSTATHAAGACTPDTAHPVCCSCPAVYGVLPCSLLFLVAYSWATQRLSRQILFNIIISSFLFLYSGFALLYPSHESLHFHMMADQVTHGWNRCMDGRAALFMCRCHISCKFTGRWLRCQCLHSNCFVTVHVRDTAPCCAVRGLCLMHSLSSYLALAPALQALTALPIGLAGVSGMKSKYIADS